jgi:hypothetical protein
MSGKCREPCRTSPQASRSKEVATADRIARDGSSLQRNCRTGDPCDWLHVTRESAAQRNESSPAPAGERGRRRKRMSRTKAAAREMDKKKRRGLPLGSINGAASLLARSIAGFARGSHLQLLAALRREGRGLLLGNGSVGSGGSSVDGGRHCVVVGGWCRV